MVKRFLQYMVGPLQLIFLKQKSHNYSSVYVIKTRLIISRSLIIFILTYIIFIYHMCNIILLAYPTGHILCGVFPF